MPIVWPVTIPPLTQVEELREEPADGALRTDMDEGPAKVRKLTNANPDIVTFEQLLTQTEVNDVRTFYKTTTSQGSLSFVDTHPATLASETMRFKSPPTFDHVGGLYFRAKYELEVLP
jgi:hypothetical protein